MPGAVLYRLWRRLEPLSVGRIPLSGPRGESCFGVAAELSKVHWVRPEMVGVSYAEWGAGRLLRKSFISENMGTNRQSTSAEALRLECASIGGRCKTP
jgi:hypothetical protein